MTVMYMDVDTNILDISGSSFLKLVDALNENDQWRTLLKSVPSNFCSVDILSIVEQRGAKSNSSYAKELLLRWGSQDVTVSDVIDWLESAGLFKVLLILKKDEPLEILYHPSHIIVSANSSIHLSCAAKSFPPPEYQWFKDNEELIMHQESDLYIQSARLEDAGTYICKVSKRNVEDNTISYLDSSPCEVKVIPSVNSKNLVQDSSPFKASIHLDINIYGPEEEFKDVEKENIQILKHPTKLQRVAQGSDALLTCKAKSVYPVKYQWFCNGRQIKGSISSELKLENLFPDHEKGDIEWEYKCQVYNNFDSIFSKSGTIQLLPADDSTQYFAEEKIALLIANDTYDNLEKLHSPPQDVAVIAQSLVSIGFKIIALRNLNYVQMKNTVKMFCSVLKSNSYGLFFYGGHGFDQCKQQTYLQPVDCSANASPDDSICVEFILQCMQKKNPALNVLLIDTCRRYPFQDSGNIKLKYTPQMKRNTVYCYATSFLCSSREYDGEPNSFFVKYLKKYITYNEKIESVIGRVKREFELEPLAKDHMYPCITSTLGPSRRLTDQILNESASAFDEMLSWSNVGSCIYEDRHYYIPSLQVTILLEIDHHKGVFCNGIDIHMFLDIGEEASILKVNQINLDLHFESDEVMIHQEFFHHTLYDPGRKYLTCTIQILQLQNLKGPLKGILLIKHRPTNTILQNVQIVLDRPNISFLKLNEFNSEIDSCFSDNSMTLEKYENLISFSDV